MYGLGSAPPPISRMQLFILLAMVWYTIANKIKNKKFRPRARSRFFEARPPQGGDPRVQALWLKAEISGLRAEGRGE